VGAGGEDIETSSLHLTMECLAPAGLALRCSHKVGDGGYDLDGFPAIGRRLRRVTARDHIQIATPQLIASQDKTSYCRISRSVPGRFRSRVQRSAERHQICRDGTSSVRRSRVPTRSE
jgi:hypothetical protein